MQACKVNRCWIELEIIDMLQISFVYPLRTRHLTTTVTGILNITIRCKSIQVFVCSYNLYALFQRYSCRPHSQSDFQTTTSHNFWCFVPKKTPFTCTLRCELIRYDIWVVDDWFRSESPPAHITLKITKRRGQQFYQNIQIFMKWCELILALKKSRSIWIQTFQLHRINMLNSWFIWFSWELFETKIDFHVVFTRDETS